MKKKFLIVTTIPWTLEFFKGQIQALKTEFDLELISSPGEKLDLLCKNEYVQSHTIPMKREISIFHDVISLFKMIFLFVKLKPAIVHGNTPKAGLLSMLAAKLTFTPLRIYFVHGLRYEGAKGFKRGLLKTMERLTCFLSTDIYVVSFGLKEKLINDGISKREINIINNGSINGIDITKFSPFNKSIPNLREEYNIKEDTLTFGFVGRLVKDKGINELIKAFLNIQKSHQHVKLILVGGFEDNLDPLDPMVKNEILNNKNIIHAGYKADIRPFLKMMDVFVFPSYREGFGLSLMESAAMGVPAISSDIIGCNEIIKHNYNGILVKAKSFQLLEEAMIDLIVNPNKIEKMGSVARDFVIQKYEQKELWRKTLESYTNLVY